MENQYKNDVFVQDLEAIKEYFETIKDKISNTSGIFDLIIAEKLTTFITQTEKIDIELLKKIRSEINYIKGLIATYKFSNKKDQEMMVKKLGPEVRRQAIAMTAYLTHVKNAMLDSIINNYTPFIIDTEAVKKVGLVKDIEFIFDKDKETQIADIDKTVESFNEKCDSYTQEQYVLK